MKRAGTPLSYRNRLKLITCMYVICKVHFVQEICFVYTDNDKPEMTMPKQIDAKVTKPQRKHGQGRTRKCPIVAEHSTDLDLKYWYYVNNTKSLCLL